MGNRQLHPAGNPQFASEAEERAYWDGVTHGLRCLTGENRRDDDEPPAARGPREEAAEILDPPAGGFAWTAGSPGRRPGSSSSSWRAVRMSVASAYALNNRRSGRAFGKMWDAIMIHRARGRLADNNLSRAMNGCVEQVLKDGVVVAERRRFDNRLSMAMLTRLDRLAESKSGEEAELLRGLSEDFEDYLEVVEAGGDEEAFLEARRRKPEEPAVKDPPVTWYTKDFVDEVAALADTSEWRDVAPPEIPIDDLDPDRMAMATGRADDEELTERLNSSPGFPGEGDHAKHGGGVLSQSEEPLHRPAGGPPPPENRGRNESPLQASTS